MNKTLISIACLLAICGVHAAVTTNATDITQATDLTVNATSGNTVYYTGAITLSGGAKLRKTGWGTIVLANGSNAFAGGIVIAEGALQVDVAGALGGDSTPISIASGSANRGRLMLNVAGMTLRNPITMTAGSAAYSADYAVIQSMTDMTMESTVETSGYGFSFGGYPVNGVNADRNLNFQTMVWDSDIDAKGGDFLLRNYGTNIINGRITCNRFNLSSAASMKFPPVHLSNSGNSITIFDNNAASISCLAPNVLGGAAVRFSGGGGSYVRMNGFSQTASYLEEYGNLNLDPSASTAEISSTGGTATLTLTGGAADGRAVSKHSICAGVALVCDFAEPSFVQVLTNRKHKTEQPLTVNSGVLSLVGQTTWPDTTAVTIGANGTLDLSTTSANSFKSVMSLTVNGTLCGSAVSSSAFSNANVALSVGPDASISCAGVLTVSSLTVGGLAKSGVFVAPTAALPQLKKGVIAVKTSSSTGWATGDDSSFSAYTALSGMTLSPANPSADGETVFSASETGASLDVLGALSLTAYANPEATSNVWRFDLPVVFRTAQTWDIPEGDTLEFAAGAIFLESLNVTGRGSIVFSGATNYMASAVLVPTNVLLSGVFRDVHPDKGNSVPTSSSLANSLESIQLKVDGDTTRCNNVFSNAVIYKSFYMRTASGPANTRSFRFVADTHNFFYGGSYLGTPKQLFIAEPGSVAEFNGETRLDWTYHVLGGGQLVFGDKSVTQKRASTATTFSVRNGALHIDAPDCCLARLSLGIDRGEREQDESWVQTVSFGRSHAITNTPIYFLSDCPHATLNLSNTVQETVLFQNFAKNTVTGDDGAELVFADGTISNDSTPVDGSATIVCNVTNGVGLTMAGSGTLVLSNRNFAATGPLTVTNGTLEIAANATWLNGEHIVVGGTGTLSLAAGCRLSSGCSIAFSDSGNLSIPAGALQRCASVTVDGGDPLPNGLYGRVADPSRHVMALSNLSGDGFLRIGEVGTQIILR